MLFIGYRWLDDRIAIRDVFEMTNGYTSPLVELQAELEHDWSRKHSEAFHSDSVHIQDVGPYDWSDASMPVRCRMSGLTSSHARR